MLRAISRPTGSAKLASIVGNIDSAGFGSGVLVGAGMNSSSVPAVAKPAAGPVPGKRRGPSLRSEPPVSPKYCPMGAALSTSHATRPEEPTMDEISFPRFDPLGPQADAREQAS
jgi:hypothetical protein